MPANLDLYLRPSACINSDHSVITELATSLCSDGNSEIQNAVALYYWVRDTIRYNPYALTLTCETLQATATLKAGEAWCVPKAILLCALCRAMGIPARVGFADVRNHLSTERMRAAMDTDIFYFHGYSSLFLNGHWVKATPAFNVSLCEKFGLKPLEFNGLEDSLYHEFDNAGNKHMEYLHDRGEYVDVPIDEMLALFRQHYPGMTPSGSIPDGTGGPLDHTQWESDVQRETST